MTSFTNDGAEWISHVEEDDSDGQDVGKTSTPTIIEVLKRKVCSDIRTGSVVKRLKGEDDGNVDLEFIEVDPADSEWMLHANPQSAASTQASSAGSIHQNSVLATSSQQEKDMLSVISVIAAKNAMESSDQTSATVSDSLAKSQWQVVLKPKYFRSVREDDVISWSGEPQLHNIISPHGRGSAMGRPGTKKASHKNKPMSTPLMLNPARTMCAFVQSNRVKGQLRLTYYCNFCQLTESTYGGIYQHLNHHLFVCGMCAYHSSSRIDVEIHRMRNNHMTPLSQGYMAHQQLVPLHKKCLHSPHDGRSLIDWKTVREETEALITIRAPRLPESAQNAFDRSFVTETLDWGKLNGPVNVLCALPYHRHVSQKSSRKNVLEYHCNFCQSTPIYTQELYRHLDFHSFRCSEKDCSFQSFTNLELFFHRRKCHAETYKDFLENLVIYVPTTFTKEEDFTEMGIGQKWSVMLNLPRDTVPDAVNKPGGRGIVLRKEREWRCKVCNNFIINKGGLTTHLVLLHNVKPQDVHLYMDPVL